MSYKLTARQLFFIVASLVVVSSCAVYNDHIVKELEGIEVGNGITLHPKKRLLLISKPTDEVSDSGKPLYRIFRLNYKDGSWCCEEQVPFSSQHTDYHPVFTPDGEWVYFNSDRPIPGSNGKSEKINIWRVKYGDDAWGNPEYLEQVNTKGHDSYPSVAADGTLYFNSDRPGGKGSMDIYESALVDGVHIKPVPIPSLNSSDSENDLTIHPKEEFIIFNRYLFSSKEIELFISYNKNGIWTEPKPLSSINKKGVWELTPTLSPDGNYFLYEKDGRIRVEKINNIKF